MRKKKPIVALAKGQNYVSGRNVSTKTDQEMKQIAKKIRK